MRPGPGIWKSGKFEICKNPKNKISQSQNSDENGEMSGGSITLVSWKESEQNKESGDAECLPSSMEVIRVIPFPSAFKEGRSYINIDLNFDVNSTIKISPNNSTIYDFNPIILTPN